MKKEVKVVISIVLAVWFFFMGFELGSYREKKSINTNAPVTTEPFFITNASEITTAPPVTDYMPANDITHATTLPDAQQTTAPSASNQETTKNSGETKTTAKNNNADPSSLSKEEIVAKMGEAVNNLKKEQKLVAVRTETVKINLTDLSIPGAKSIINSVIQRLAGEEKYTYTFQNGQAVGIDDSGKEDEDGMQTVNQAIAPKDKPFSLTADGVAVASAQKEGANTVYKVKLVEESTTFTEPIPKHNSTAFSYLDLTTLDISGATITDATMHYPGTEITATVNAQGKLIAIHYYMPMDGYGAAKITLMNGNATFEGSDDESWTFTY